MSDTKRERILQTGYETRLLFLPGRSCHSFPLVISLQVTLVESQHLSNLRFSMTDAVHKRRKSEYLPLIDFWPPFSCLIRAATYSSRLGIQGWLRVRCQFKFGGNIFPKETCSTGKEPLPFQMSLFFSLGLLSILDTLVSHMASSCSNLYTHAYTRQTLTASGPIRSSMTWTQ